jgi:hypothetical protein
MIGFGPNITTSALSPGMNALLNELNAVSTCAPQDGAGPQPSRPSAARQAPRYQAARLDFGRIAIRAFSPCGKLRYIDLSPPAADDLSADKN